MLSNSQTPKQALSVRAGFTLVEMMVAVALVLVMMTMFAEIFTLATASMSKQKAIAELDQRQRIISTIVRSDIQNRSFAIVFPFHKADSATNAVNVNFPCNISYSQRFGYFYVSENDPDDDTDDVLQFTVTRPADDPFFGRAWPLLDNSSPQNGEGTNPAILNQPEYDDGQAFNFVGSSPSAEVSYFLRHGTLYRRVLLIRKPLDRDGATDDDPSNSGGLVSLIQTGIYPQGSGMGGSVYTQSFPPAVNNNFLSDFDYSATYDFSGPRLVFNGVSTLDPSNPRPIAATSNRFGFQPNTGLPLEYLPGHVFFGRFTQEETSNAAFGWPGDHGKGADNTIGTSDDTNPYTRTGLVLNPNGSVTAFADGSRKGEDMLLTNVQAFDIKVWDSAANVGPDGQPGVAGYDDDHNGTVDDISELGWPSTGSSAVLGSYNDDGVFVDIGHSGLIGDYRAANNSNPAFGPWTSPNRCFDTWHPSLSGSAPFRAVRQIGQPGKNGIDDDGDGTVDNASELGYPNSDDLAVPLKAIQVRIRYLDVSSGQVREMTIVESLR